MEQVQYGATVIRRQLYRRPYQPRPCINPFPQTTSFAPSPASSFLPCTTVTFSPSMSRFLLLPSTVFLRLVLPSLLPCSGSPPSPSGTPFHHSSLFCPYFYLSSTSSSSTLQSFPFSLLSQASTYSSASRFPIWQYYKSYLSPVFPLPAPRLLQLPLCPPLPSSLPLHSPCDFLPLTSLS